MGQLEKLEMALVHLQKRPPINMFERRQNHKITLKIIIISLVYGHIWWWGRRV